MQQLKKIAMVGGAIALAACWPLAVGQIGQKLVHNGIQDMQMQGYSAELISYKRGYLSSVAVTHYAISDPVTKQRLEQDGLPTEISLKHKIRHSLFSINTETVPVSDADIPAVLHTTTQLNGNTEFTLFVDTINHTNDDGSLIEVASSEMKGHVSVSGQVDFILDVPSVNLGFVNGEALQIHEIKGSGDGIKEDGFLLGSHQFMLKNITLTGADNVALFQGSDISYQIRSQKNKQNERIDSRHILQGSQFITAGEHVDKALIDFTWGDLDIKTMQALTEQNEDDPASLSASADAFFNKGFYFAVNDMQISVGDGGLFDTRWRLTLPEGVANITADMSKILPVLEGNLSTFISGEMLVRYPYFKPGLDELIMMEMAKETEKGIQINAEIKQGNVEFEGGAKVPLFSLLLPVFL
ncbi:hypothetical protein CSW98_01205 [Vibrio sp. HA2012]|uniref:DUF945 family protein n=1 Tax=Vibrio sp. HA2012 TaxID=1971595 RepID=UPI000C2C9F36|nr:DUF945 family protein [Vibrio sp. HA2012]PJC87774.1 hypothetical protein CSW98_01205 [Vibrio sp. HA2012]